LKAGSVKIERFEDIEDWKAARKLTEGIYALTSQPRFAQESMVGSARRVDGSIEKLGKRG
jgi:hypothetical protein